jgi:hypothetical protein
MYYEFYCLLFPKMQQFLFSLLLNGFINNLLQKMLQQMFVHSGRIFF